MRRLTTILLVLLSTLAVSSLSSCVIPPSTFTTRPGITGLVIAPEGRWHDVLLNVRDWRQKMSLPDLENPTPQLALVFSRRWLLEYLSGEPVANYPTDLKPYLAATQANQERLDADFQDAANKLSRDWLLVLSSLMDRGTFYTHASVINLAYVDSKGLLIGPNTATLEVDYQARGVPTRQHLELTFVMEYEEWRIDGLSIAPLEMSTLLPKE